MATINKTFGVADPQYDALRVQSNQAIWPDAGGAPVGGAGGLENKIYLWHTDGSTVDLFAPDATGLGLALAAAASGDTVWLPSIPIALTAAVTIPAGVTMRGIEQSAIISRTANSAADLVTVQGPSSGIAYLSHVTINCTQNGSGDAVALLGGAGQIYAHDCTFNGQSTSGDGYAVNPGAGQITIDYCYLIGSTDEILGTGSAPVVGAEITNGSIPVTNSGGTTIGGLTIGNWYAVKVAGSWTFADAIYDPRDTTHYEVNNGSGWQASSNWYDGIFAPDDGSWPAMTKPSWAYSISCVTTCSGTNRLKIYQIIWHATTTSISIRASDDIFGDNAGTFTWHLLAVTAPSAASPLVYAVHNGQDGTPEPGDRSAWNAASYQDLHTNDLDDATGIHHTLGAGATQAAPGNHTHDFSSVTQYFLSTFRTSDEKLYLLTSSDATSWISLDSQPAYTPATGSLRDPSIARFGGYYWVCHTHPITGALDPETQFQVIRSADLVTWELIATVDMTAISGVDHVWAPEWFIDTDSSIHVVVSCSTDNASTFRSYEVHPTDGTLTTWTTPVQITWSAGTPNAIDYFIVYKAGTYYLWYRNLSGDYIEVSSSASLLSGYTVLQSGNWAGWGAQREGPCLVQIDDTTWRIWVDEYFGDNGPYYSDSVDDWATWSALTAISAPYSIRHATILKQTTGGIDHGELAGLADDDHLQYLTVDRHLAIGNSSPHHAPVTLGGGSDPALVLSGQQLTLTLTEVDVPISVYNETQTADGTSLIYYLVNFAAPGTIRSYIDGIRQPISDDDDPTDVVTFSSAPGAGALLLFDYELDI